MSKIEYIRSEYLTKNIKNKQYSFINASIHHPEYFPSKIEFPVSHSFYSCANAQRNHFISSTLCIYMLFIFT